MRYNCFQVTEVEVIELEPSVDKDRLMIMEGVLLYVVRAQDPVVGTSIDRYSDHRFVQIRTVGGSDLISTGAWYPKKANGGGEKCGQVDLVATAEAFVRQKLGSMLIAAIEKSAKRNGLDCLQLTSAGPDNPRYFYESNGYSVIGPTHPDVSRMYKRLIV